MAQLGALQQQYERLVTQLLVQARLEINPRFNSKAIQKHIEAALRQLGMELNGQRAGLTATVGNEYLALLLHETEHRQQQSCCLSPVALPKRRIEMGYAGREVATDLPWSIRATNRKDRDITCQRSVNDVVHDTTRLAASTGQVGNDLWDTVIRQDRRELQQVRDVRKIAYRMGDGILKRLRSGMTGLMDDHNAGDRSNNCFFSLHFFRDKKGHSSEASHSRSRAGQ